MEERHVWGIVAHYHSCHMKVLKVLCCLVERVSSIVLGRSFLASRRRTRSAHCGGFVRLSLALFVETSRFLLCCKARPWRARQEHRDGFAKVLMSICIGSHSTENANGGGMVVDIGVVDRGNVAPECRERVSQDRAYVRSGRRSTCGGAKSLVSKV